MLGKVVSKRQRRVGMHPWSLGGHKIWEWHVDKAKGKLNWHIGEGVEVFSHIRCTLYSHAGQVSQKVIKEGLIALVEEISPGLWKMHSTEEPSIGPDILSDFLDILLGWENMWLWDDLTLHGGSDWLATAISGGTLLAVTDGAYIREQYPHLCSAAFIFGMFPGMQMADWVLLRVLSGGECVPWGAPWTHGYTPASILAVHTCRSDIEGSVVVFTLLAWECLVE